MDKKSEFILAAILDIQATNRAIDVKIGALLLVLIAPFSKLGRICSHFEYLGNNYNHNLVLFLTVIFFSSWVLAISALIKAMAAIDNPRKHIVNANNFKGSFYGGGLYDIGLADILLNRKVIKANMDVATFSSNLPNTVNDIEEELAFEQLKVIYIRDMKLYRLKWGLILSLTWSITGLVTYILSKSV